MLKKGTYAAAASIAILALYIGIGKRPESSLINVDHHRHHEVNRAVSMNTIGHRHDVSTAATGHHSFVLSTYSVMMQRATLELLPAAFSHPPPPPHHHHHHLPSDWVTEHNGTLAELRVALSDIDKYVPVVRALKAGMEHELWQAKHLLKYWSLLQQRIDALQCNGPRGGPMKPLNEWLFPKPAEAYQLQKWTTYMVSNSAANASCRGASIPELLDAESQALLIASEILQKQDCKSVFFGQASSSALLTVPGLEVTAIADIIRLDLVEKDAIGVEAVMTLRIVPQPHIISEFELHPYQTMDEKAHYHLDTNLEINATKFISLVQQQFSLKRREVLAASNNRLHRLQGQGYQLPELQVFVKGSSCPTTPSPPVVYGQPPPGGCPGQGTGGLCQAICLFGSCQPGPPCQWTCTSSSTWTWAGGECPPPATCSNLTAISGSSICSAGSNTPTALFSYSAVNLTGASFTVNPSGCSITPASTSTSPVTLNVTCINPGSPGAYNITVTANATFINGTSCASTQTAFAVALVRPPPSVALAFIGSQPLAGCSNSIEQGGQTFVLTYNYTVTADPTLGPLTPFYANVSPRGSNAAFTNCSVTRGPVNATGTLEVTCTTTATSPAQVKVRLFAGQAGCGYATRATYTHTIPMTCCTQVTSDAKALFIGAQTGCRSCPNNFTPYIQGPGQGTVYSGLTGSTCPSSPPSAAVGLVAISCITGRNAAFFAVTLPVSSSVTIAYMVSCPPASNLFGASCPSFTGLFRTRQNNMTVTNTGGRQVVAWQVPVMSSCPCSNNFYAVSLAGTLGNCSAPP